MVPTAGGLLKPRKKFGKYKIARRIAQGGFANVYQAYDTVEGIHVALKVPHTHLLNEESLADFRQEVRLTAKLDHAHIQPIKYAGSIENVFVIVYPLGERTLDERMKRRLALKTVLIYAEQMIEALAHAHQRKIIHCDVKPENIILFPGNKLRLADFGIAKLALRTLSASGSGTVGYLAPEQALGKPSFRSDVFSLGLIFYQMLSGRLPEWPFDWPLAGFEKVKRKLHRDWIAFLRKSMEVDERKRFGDAVQMLAAFRRLKQRPLRGAAPRRRRRKREDEKKRDWQVVRLREFQRRYGKTLEVRATCPRCEGPMAERMPHCPWCGVKRKRYRGPTGFPARCRRCGCGMKLDWRFCPWCYGAGYEADSAREYSDVRYQGRCANPACSRKALMPFMRYCPWCRRKVKRKWKVSRSDAKCPRCRWGVLSEFWGYCPWCGLGLQK